MTVFRQILISVLLLLSAPAMAADCDGDLLIEQFSAMGFKKLMIVNKMWAQRNLEHEKTDGFRRYALDNQDYLLFKIPDIGEIDDKTRTNMIAQAMENFSSVDIVEYDNAELARIAATKAHDDYGDYLKSAGNYVIYSSNHSVAIEPIVDLVLACNKPLYTVFRKDDNVGFDIPGKWQEYKINQPEISDIITDRKKNAP